MLDTACFDAARDIARIYARYVLAQQHVAPSAYARCASVMRSRVAYMLPPGRGERRRVCASAMKDAQRITYHLARIDTRYACARAILRRRAVTAAAILCAAAMAYEQRREH